jgi:hypothetical protein
MTKQTATIASTQQKDAIIRGGNGKKKAKAA